MSDVDDLGRRTWRAMSAIDEVVTTPGASFEAVHAALLRVQARLDARIAQTATPPHKSDSVLPYDPAGRLKERA